MNEAQRTTHTAPAFPLDRKAFVKRHKPSQITINVFGLQSS